MGLVLDFRRAAWFVPAFFLNILFLGTSHALSHFPIQYWALYVYVTVNLSLPFQGNIQTFYDASSVVLAVLTLILSYLAFRRQGRKSAILSTLQIMSLSFLPLGIEIFLFDRSEWNLHVAELQSTYNLIPWFTNADLFFLTSGLLITTTLYLMSSRSKSRVNVVIPHHDLWGKLDRLYGFYVNRKSLTFGATGLVNLAFGELLLTWLTTARGIPLELSSPLTVYVTILVDYVLKSKLVFHEPTSLGMLAKYHVNGLSSKVAQVLVTVGLSFFMPYQVSYLLGVSGGFVENYAVATLFTFNKTQKELTPEVGKVKINVGCPRFCEGYTCVDLSPLDPLVKRGEAINYLTLHSVNTYDEIFTKNMFEHLPNPGNFIKICHDSLKNGGRLVLITDNAEFLPYYLPIRLNHTGVGAHARKEYAESADHGHTLHFGVYTKMHLRNLLENYGFRDITVKRILFGSRLKAVAIK